MLRDSDKSRPSAELLQLACPHVRAGGPQSSKDVLDSGSHIASVLHLDSLTLRCTTLTHTDGVCRDAVLPGLSGAPLQVYELTDTVNPPFTLPLSHSSLASQTHIHTSRLRGLLAPLCVCACSVFTILDGRGCSYRYSATPPEYFCMAVAELMP